jgi:hypothetical protein
MIGHNKLEVYTALVCEGLPLANNLAYCFQFYKENEVL